MVNKREEALLQSLSGKLLPKNEMIQNINKIKKVQILQGIITKAKQLLKEVETPLIKSNIEQLNKTENLNIYAEDWKNYIREYIQNNWIEQKELMSIKGGKDIIEYHDKLINALNVVSKSDKDVFMTQRKVTEFKDKGANRSLIDKAFFKNKQGLRPKIFIPQEEIEYKIRE
jgi:hypothetical protein